MIRNIKTFQDTERALKDLSARLDLLDTKNIDMHGRRVIRAHPSVDLDDYVVRREILPLEKEVVQIIQTASQDYEIATFNISVDEDLEVSNNVCPYHIVATPSDNTLFKAYAVLKEAAVGQDVKLRARKNIGLPSEATLCTITIPQNSLAVATLSVFDSTSLSDEDYIGVDVIQIGTTVAGGTCSFKLMYRKS